MNPKRDADDENDEVKNTKNDDGKSSFEPGDHVFQWCTFMGVPHAFQHHGLVLEVDPVAGVATIMDFTALIPENSESPLSITPRKFPSRVKRSILNADMSDTTWRKVQYSTPWHETLLKRLGTCTFAEADPAGLAVSRANFLLKNKHIIPPCHLLRSNCECVAVWCKTGRWATLQASSFLRGATRGMVMSTAMAAGVAAGQTVAAKGIWGFMGAQPLLATCPILIPAIVGYGVVAVGGSVYFKREVEVAWNETSEVLNDEYWCWTEL